MAFTLITITGGPFLRPDGQPATGRLTAILSARMANGASIIDPAPVYGVLNGAGILKDGTGERPLALEANDDPATTPSAPSASYEFTLELDGAPIDPFSAIIPHLAAAQTIDLSELMP